ncbi:MAG: hypothetical protein IPP63_08260 [Chloracidobacterium sp.]|nr:hypothetical protein [Chloracidobacterium sp.]
MNVKIKFDKIFWNAPFIKADRNNMDLLERSVFDPNYRSIEKYLSGFDRYVEEDGRAFLGFSSSSGDNGMLERLCLRNHVSLKLVEESRLKDGDGHDDFALELYELLRVQVN